MNAVQNNYLLPLQGKIKPLKVAVFDIESTKWTHFEGLGFYDGETYSFFASVPDFLDYILTRRYGGYTIFAHAGSHFDFSFLLDELRKDSRGFQIIMAAGDTGIWNIRLEKRIKKGKKSKVDYKILFSDSYRLLPMSLSKLGKSFQTPHQKIELPITKLHNLDKGYHVFSSSMSNILQFDNWMDYLKNDCLCLYECVQAFYSMVNEHGGNCKLTLASSAMDIFRRHYLESPIKNYRKHEGIVRQAYYGGRCEVFKLYGENLFYYDFNSLYPWIMQKYKVPVGSIVIDKSIREPGFSLCKIVAPEIRIPVLPFRKDGKLIFPIGNFTGWYDNELLRYAKTCGYKIEVQNSVNFSDESFIFKKFVNDFYKIKEDAERSKNSGLRLVAKLILNSTYGKFGQRREIEKLIINRGGVDGSIPYNEDYGLYLVKEKSRANFILPAIAAHITAMAGLELHKKLVEADDVYYCDTDSIITSTLLDTGHKLGDLKCEHEIDKGYFLLPKVYAVLTADGKTIIKAKGFSNDLRETLTFRDIAQFGKQCFKEKSENFLSMRESLRRMNRFVSKAVVKKSIQKEYDKRIVNPDFTTTPIRLR